MLPTLQVLPSQHERPTTNEVGEWLFENARRVTVATLLATKNPRTDLLAVMLAALRWANRGKKAVLPGSQYNREMTESALRSEVHNYPDKFCFGVSELCEYSPIHVGEMIAIVIDLLKKQGIDARVPTQTSPEIGIKFN